MRTDPAARASRRAWARGEGYIVAQFALFFLVLFGPRAWSGWPESAIPGGRWATLAALGLWAIGACLVAGGLAKLGAAATPLPYPRANSHLRETGVYRLARHPIYGGVLLASLGWALFRRSWPTLGYAALAWLFLEAKVRREERWLLERFPEYANYRKRTRKLIPFVY